MQPQPDGGDFQALKAKLRSLWTMGDFGKIAPHVAASEQQFVDRLQLKPGAQLLDVGCGSGNTAIPAARAGAKVTGIDIAPNLLATARANAEREELAIQFDEGDAEELPYGAGQFDVVISVFGAMFAPRPEKVVSEFARVCRSGGLIAMVSWTPRSFIAKTSEISARYAPPPPGLANPMLWGDEATARERFAGVGEISTQRHEAVLDYPFGPAELLTFLRTNLGSAAATYARLDAEGQRQITADMEKLHHEYNQGDETRTIIGSEYLELRVRKAG